MIKGIKKLKKIRIHCEGTDSLIWGFIVVAAIILLSWRSSETKTSLYVFTVIFGTIYCIVINFFQCPIHYFPSEDTGEIVVAPADNKIVMIEEVEKNKCFHGKRLMISVFMSLFNVHVNRSPVDGKVKLVHHQNGNYHKAWLPKASEENGHSDVIITTPDGVGVLCRQVAGAMARRIVTYAKEDEDCYIDEHLGFVKFGSCVDVYLPIRTEVYVKVGQKTIGDHIVIAKLK